MSSAPRLYPCPPKQPVPSPHTHKRSRLQLREDLLREVLFRRARKCSADEPLSDAVDVIKGGGRSSFPDGLSPGTVGGMGTPVPLLPSLFPALSAGAAAGE